jgi:hypothetical protein
VAALNGHQNGWHEAPPPTCSRSRRATG